MSTTEDTRTGETISGACHDCGAKASERDLVSRWRTFSAGISGSARVCADRKACNGRMKHGRLTGGQR